MTSSITSIYAAVLALLFVILSVRAIRLRRTLFIAVGDGGNAKLKKALRAHGNFAEYAPLALLMIFLMEVRGVSHFWVHGCCILLLVGRILHAIGVSQVDERYWLRVTGMTLTFAALIASASRILAGLVSPG